jgi:putative membrane protein
MAPGREEMITMMFWYGGGWAWWQAGLMWLAMIAFWGLLVWAIYALVSGITRRTEAAPGEQRQPGDARRILDERLARGEIDTEEYQRLHDVLDGDRGRSAAGSGSTR